jgi:hypothetical protein
MGNLDAARVDVAVLSGVARGYDAVADMVDAAVRTHLGAPRFTGATAGRAHAARGDTLARAVDDVSDQMRQWARACAEIAAALRASADRYVEADARAAHRVT